MNKVKLIITGLLLFALPLGNTLQAESYLEKSKGTTIDSLNPQELNWYNLDPEKDNVPGASVNRTYQELIRDKIPKKDIIVAVIDGGVDVDHIDLQGKLWINDKEVPGNGIDDDQNGYVDDIHGWNFLGNNNGEHINYANLEFVRLYRKLHPKFKDISVRSLSSDEKEEYELYLKVKARYEDEVEKYLMEKKSIEEFEERYFNAKVKLREYTKNEQLTLDDIKNIKSKDEDILHAKSFMLFLYNNGFTSDSFEEMKQHVNEYLNKHLNIEFIPRKIISDDIENIADNNYGNNDVEGPSAEHGSFVAGIIGAKRGNQVGIEGIANNVKIMVLRAVPQGDEYDKDIALSIRYAVDNGANIINMSFGKNFSPQKKLVDEAVKYAAKNNVLMVCSAGNSSYDIDEIEVYPSDHLYDKSGIENWITVGATTMYNNKNLVGNFTNYGRKNVDIFAPGVDIISLYPEDKYMSASGTSFSSPVVSGVAALVWSYYPELSAAKLKDILLKSITNYRKKKVYYPGINISNGKMKTTKFKKLSQTGGIVNAYNAFLLADKYTN